MDEYKTNVKASEVKGVKVKNIDNEDLGEINEIVLDKNTGKVSYLVLDFGGFLSFGNKYFAIPWSAFQYNKEDDSFILNVDKDRLKNAPGFDKNDWPDFANQEFTMSLTRFYQ